MRIGDGGLSAAIAFLPYRNTASEPHLPNISVGNAVIEDINFTPPTPLQ
ncbi:MAG TPA: hypothetical protein VGQ65_06335 [Thermoanaerobaculia bacterium]|jgi:hypothetical protein|nr:hypothetical protein [Thermoanaerobaculia bacterium]